MRESVFATTEMCLCSSHAIGNLSSTINVLESGYATMETAETESLISYCRMALVYIDCWCVSTCSTCVSPPLLSSLVSIYHIVCECIYLNKLSWQREDEHESNISFSQSRQQNESSSETFAYTHLLDSIEVSLFLNFWQIIGVVYWDRSNVVHPSFPTYR